MHKPVVLAILDGWGLGKTEKGNAIAKSTLPTIDRLNQFYPSTALQASGISVGLPWGEAGNSEVGHMTMGAGKIIYQNMPRITMDIQTGMFAKNKVFLDTIAHTEKHNSSLHLMGLMGKGVVHSYIDHLYALLELARNHKVKKVFLHLFTDGRDSPNTSAAISIREVQRRMKMYNIGKLATISGRYFAMDRNNNWDRTQKAYEMLTKGEGEKITDPEKYLENSYKKEVFDEYIEPAVLTENGRPVATIQDNDAVIFFNFREDRARQLTKAFVLPGFMKFKKKDLKNIEFVTMVQYEEGLPVEVAYPPIGINESLGKTISHNNLYQLRISETEKFAHVTFIFNGGTEEVFPREDRVIVPSVPVESFDKAPEMSAREITDKVIAFIEKEKYDFILINYANADIVGHTGKEKATIQAVETIDQCLGKLIPSVLLKNGCLLITSDHGNAEELQNNLTGEVDTEHSINPVPCWFVTSENHRRDPRKNKDSLQKDQEPAGLLSDIAPTVLELLNLEKPEEMTGESLLDILK